MAPLRDSLGAGCNQWPDPESHVGGLIDRSIDSVHWSGRYSGAGGWTSNDFERDALKRQTADGQLDATMALNGTRSIAKRAVELSLIVKSGADRNRDRLGKDPVYESFFERIDATSQAFTTPCS